MSISGYSHMETFYLYPICNNLNDKGKDEDGKETKTIDVKKDFGFDAVLREKSLQLQ